MAVKNLLIIATQELNVLLAKMKLEFDTLVASYRLDANAIKLLNKVHTAWESYVDAELKLVEHKWAGDSTQALHVNARHQELVISYIQELKNKL
jgi:uncharacterized protein YecT (DUF1311 family)